MNSSYKKHWPNRSVLVTGHTGFKGGWIALWLSCMGARVHGYSLVPPTTPSFFAETRLERKLASSTVGDVRDLQRLSETIKKVNPAVIFHLAAQPLVRESYRTPVETFSTNVIGTVNLLDAARKANSVEAIVVVTSDKCYEDQKCIRPYREDDRLGGYDPYSSSKACAELVTTAFGNSFLKSSGVQVATARAGNVIGGGDWAAERIVPDILRALDAGERIKLRSPNAIRPWQHVLEPLAGYLSLAEKMLECKNDYSEAWNFGPPDADCKPVSWIANYMGNSICESAQDLSIVHQLHETDTLRVDSTKSKSRLGWATRWPLNRAIDETLAWHAAWKNGENMADFSARQIEVYQST